MTKKAPGTQLRILMPEVWIHLISSKTLTKETAKNPKEELTCTVNYLTTDNEWKLFRNRGSQVDLEN